MNAEQAKLFLFAQAEVVRVAGMQALNQYRDMRGESQAYDEEAFAEAANRIENLAIQLINS